MTTNPGFPRLNTPFVRDDKVLAFPWDKFLIDLWQKAGGSFTPVAGAVVIINTAQGLEAIDVTTGASLGFISSSIGGDPVVVVPVTSPYDYLAGQSGTLAVFGARVDLSRDNGLNYYPITLTGGPVPLLLGDLAHLTWFSADPPTVTFFPSAA